jgi:hypothetical protein
MMATDRVMAPMQDAVVVVVVVRSSSERKNGAFQPFFFSSILILGTIRACHKPPILAIHPHVTCEKHVLFMMALTKRYGNAPVLNVFAVQTPPPTTTTTTSSSSIAVPLFLTKTNEHAAAFFLWCCVFKIANNRPCACFGGSCHMFFFTIMLQCSLHPCKLPEPLREICHRWPTRLPPL